MGGFPLLWLDRLETEKLHKIAEVIKKMYNIVISTLIYVASHSAYTFFSYGCMCGPPVQYQSLHLSITYSVLQYYVTYHINRVSATVTSDI